MSFTPTRNKFKLPSDSSAMPLNSSESFYNYQSNQKVTKPSCIQSSFSTNNQYIEKDYILDLAQSQSTTSVSTLPIENLSIHQTMSNEWISPLEANYSNYSQNEMNCKLIQICIN